MEITYKNKSYALGKKDRNIEGEAPAVRVKMLDNETKVSTIWGVNASATVRTPLLGNPNIFLCSAWPSGYTI